MGNEPITAEITLARQLALLTAIHVTAQRAHAKVCLGYVLMFAYAAAVARYVWILIKRVRIEHLRN